MFHTLTPPAPPPLTRSSKLTSLRQVECRVQPPIAPIQDEQELAYLKILGSSAVLTFLWQWLETGEAATSCQKKNGSLHMFRLPSQDQSTGDGKKVTVNHSDLLIKLFRYIYIYKITFVAKIRKA